MSFLNSLSVTVAKPLLTLLSRRALPQVNGMIYTPGIRDSVMIRRDNWGIPRIQASNRHDLFFGQGFVHAQDRLWQMELNRRAANGTLSAVVGREALDTDRLTRTLGFIRLARQTWQTTNGQVREDVEAYTAGVNAFLANEPALPLEFSLLRHRPAPWSPLDSIAFGRLMAWILSHGFAAKLVRAQLIEKLGPELAAELEPQYPDQNPLTLPEGIEFNILGVDGMLRAAAGPYLSRSMENFGRGSNGWVIGAERSTTGSPILCNDMHLPIPTPSLWYFLHLREQGTREEDVRLQVTGVSMPGVPYVLVGRNRHIAWGATVSFVDSEDLFVERMHPDNPGLYEFQGQWRQAQVFEEIIAVRGQPSHLEQVIVSHHGPLINSTVPANGQVLSLQSVALQPNESFTGFALLNQASSWDDFAHAVSQIDTPTINLLFADERGNIGYYVTGRAPIRTSGQGLIPMPGWSGEYDWIGTVPFEAMPHALNPTQGFLVSANHRIIGDDYPHYLGCAWRNGFRARRIEDLITTFRKVSPEDCRRLQLDQVCLPGLALVNLIADLEPGELDARQSLELLRKWDGTLSAGSIGGAVYRIFQTRLAWKLLEPKLGPNLAGAFLGAGFEPTLYPINEFHGHWTSTLLRWLEDDNCLWLSEGRERLMLSCLCETTSFLRKTLGPNPDNWVWGRLNHIRFRHALGVKRPLDVILGHGPYPVGGDADTVAQVSTATEDPAEHIAPSFRQIITLDHMDGSEAMFAPGQSGHLASPHYGDLVQPWLSGRYFNVSWKFEESSGAIEQTLTLTCTLVSGSFATS